jgi:hypothetical protein
MERPRGARCAYVYASPFPWCESHESGLYSVKTCISTLLIRPAVYGIATLELIVRSVTRCYGNCVHGDLQVQRNRAIIQPGEDAWGFGQIIALVLISGNLIDIWMAVRERRKRRIERLAEHPPA